MSNRPEQARQVLRQLKEVPRQQCVSGYHLAGIYAALGEKDKALDWLERAADERSPLIVYLKVDPQFEKLRSEPRFAALLKRMGLAG